MYLIQKNSQSNINLQQGFLLRNKTNILINNKEFKNNKTWLKNIYKKPTMSQYN